MFTSIRQYRCDPADAPELAHRADEQFADELASLPGFVAYELIDCGSGDVFTTTVFTDRESAERSAQLAAAFVREAMADVEISRIASYTGQVLVNRASSDVLEHVHA